MTRSYAAHQAPRAQSRRPSSSGSERSGRTIRDRATGTSGRQRLKLWDTRTGRELVTLSGGGAAICSLAFSPDGRTLASGGVDGEVKLWDVATAQELISLVGHTGAVRCTAFSPDGNTLATAGASADGQRGEIKFWRTDSAELRSITAKKGLIRIQRAHADRAPMCGMNKI